MLSSFFYCIIIKDTNLSRVLFKQKKINHLDWFLYINVRKSSNRNVIELNDNEILDFYNKNQYQFIILVRFFLTSSIFHWRIIYKNKKTLYLRVKIQMEEFSRKLLTPFRYQYNAYLKLFQRCWTNFWKVFKFSCNYARILTIH